MSVYVDPNAITRSSGPDIATPLAVTPPFDPNNPLGFTAAAPGYLPPDQRPKVRDPDLGWSENMLPGYLGPANLTPDEINAQNQAERDWAAMDQKYYSAREQNPLPLVLGAAGLIAAPFALSALGIGAGAGAGAAGAAGGGPGAGALGVDAGLAGAGAGTAGALGTGTAAALGANTVSELVVTAAAQGLSIPAIAASIGIPAATVGSILASSGGGSLAGGAGTDTVSAPTDVEGLTVTGPAPGGVDAGLGVPLGLTAVSPALVHGVDPVTTVDPLTVTAPKVVTDPVTNPLAKPLIAGGVGAGIGGLLSAIKSGDPSNVGDWVKANPLQAAALGLTVAGALGGGTTGGGGSFGVPTGSGAPGTLSSLSPAFSAALPAPTMAARNPRPLPQGIDWSRYAIEGPAQSFFSNIPQAAPAQFTVPTPQQIGLQGANNLGVSSLDAIRKAFRGYAKGGYAVHGPGTGTSDSIPAMLSNGEYVLDAKTVARLGDGSNHIGAKRLDEFRVKLRRATGGYV